LRTIRHLAVIVPEAAMPVAARGQDSEAARRTSKRAGLDGVERVAVPRLRVVSALAAVRRRSRAAR
jgi:hypothetical protein